METFANIEFSKQLNQRISDPEYAPLPNLYNAFHLLADLDDNLFNLSCLRSYYSLNDPQCLSYLFKLIYCMRINCNFYYEIVRNKWFKQFLFRHNIRTTLPTPHTTTLHHKRDQLSNAATTCGSTPHLAEIIAPNIPVPTAVVIACALTH